MFKDIIGHENIKKILLNIDRNVNSYLFYGDYGIGKFKVAEEFAKSLLKTEDLETCVDYKYIINADDKKNISVSQVREQVVEGINEKPFSCDKKVYIIDDADLLNKSAQNALLKTLEEPPNYVVIILVTSNISSLLPTIISRVNKIHFNPLSKKDMIRYVKLNNISVSDDIIKFCNGSIGLLNKVVNLEYIDILNKIDELVNNIVLKDLMKSFDLISKINFKDDIICSYFEYKCLSINKYSWIEYIEELKYRLQFNSNYDIVLDNMILRCIEDRT